jgi:hypothetical protein
VFAFVLTFDAGLAFRSRLEGELLVAADSAEALQGPRLRVGGLLYPTSPDELGIGATVTKVLDQEGNA